MVADEIAGPDPRDATTIKSQFKRIDLNQNAKSFERIRFGIPQVSNVWPEPGNYWRYDRAEPLRCVPVPVTVTQSNRSMYSYGPERVRVQTRCFRYGTEQC